MNHDDARHAEIDVLAYICNLTIPNNPIIIME